MCIMFQIGQLKSRLCVKINITWIHNAKFKVFEVWFSNREVLRI